MSYRNHLRWIIAALVILCTVSCQQQASEYLAPEFLQILVEVDGSTAHFQGSLTNGRVEECGILLLAGDEKTLVPARLDGTRFEAYASGLRVDRSYSWQAYARAGENEIRSEEFTLAVTDGIIPIPDPVFKAWLLLNYDADGDREISLSEAGAVRHIKFCTNELNVKSLSGIEYMPNLEEIDCPGKASTGTLESLDVTHNPGLRILRVPDNAALGAHQQGLDLSKNPKLERLDLSRTALPIPDLARLPGLVELEIASLKGSPPDLSQNGKLQILDVSGNGWTELDVSAFPELQSLDCSGNRFRTLDVSSSPSLLRLKMAPGAVDGLPETLFIAIGQWILGVTVDRSEEFIPSYTRIVEKYAPLDPSEAGEYQVGDVVEAYGLGIVVGIFEDGRILLMSVEELQHRNWRESNDWCAAYGDSWRMPEIEELTLIHNEFDRVNVALEGLNRQPLAVDDNCYWSATVNPEDADYYYREKLHTGEIFTNLGSDEHKNSRMNFTRAVKTVSAKDISTLVLRPSFDLREIIEADGLGVVAHVFPNGEVMLMSVQGISGKNWDDSNRWCLAYGDGWRMPTIGELTLIHRNFTLVNRSLSARDYPTMTTDNYCHWSATVNPEDADYYYREKLHTGEIFTNLGSDEHKNSRMNFTRAVKIIQTTR